ncbi:MAG: AmmeMemoRadiSam system protein B [Candidatus Omnitrophota bacterium]
MRLIILRKICLLFAAVTAFLTLNAGAKNADLAGQWYPSSPEELKKEIDGYLENSYLDSLDGEVIGAIAPHAGIGYSGPIAGYSYRAIQKKNPDKIILVGFTHHRFRENKIAVFTDEYFSTPLGKMAIEKDITNRFLEYGGNIEEDPEAFVSENSIEIQIPFIQAAAKNAKLIILAMTDQSSGNYKFLAEAIYSIMKDEKDFVIIASTDMSHYLTYEEANKKDRKTLEMIEAMSPDGLYEGSMKDRHGLMCGYGAVCAVMEASKKLGADRVRVLKYANSGDTSGMKDRVVGYLSAVFVKADKGEEGGNNMLNKTQREELLKIARDTIRYRLTEGGYLEVNTEDEELKKNMGAFVTLHKDGRLRGCIGSMIAREPLYLAVRDMAVASATEDLRFPSVTIGELDDIDIEISVLTPMKKNDDHNDIEIGKHGVMVQRGRNSGVYLPQVADETGWNKEQFMDSLCAQKAGIPQNSWRTGECDIYTFTAEVFGEKDK